MIGKLMQNRPRKPHYSGPRAIKSVKIRLFFNLMVTAVVSLGLLHFVHAATLKPGMVDLQIRGCKSGHCEVVPARPHLMTFVRTTRAATSAHVGPWHLVRTPAPENKETVSIMRTGELLKSDPDFAGLMIRCRESVGLQIGFIVISPFPPKSHPAVKISTEKSSLHFKAAVISPGTIVTLPDEADALIQGPWQSARSLTVQIEDGRTRIDGTVSLKQFAGAVALLQANCPVR